MRRVSSTAAILLALLVSLVVLPAATAHRSSGTATVVVNAAYNAELGKTILVDGRGHTLYAWTADYGGKPTCYDDVTYHCSKSWPPLLSTGAAHAGKGVKASLLGTVTRTDGKVQVTYHNWPLYTDAGGRAFGLSADKKPGDTNGQGFAGIWYVLSPAGAMLTH